LGDFASAGSESYLGGMALLSKAKTSDRLPPAAVNGAGGTPVDIVSRRPFMSMRPEFGFVSLDDGEGQSEKPKTLVVLVLLIGAAGVMSFLCSYALSNVLIQADLLTAWKGGVDPRPKWLLMSFAVFLGGFGTLGAVARQMSQSQLKRIDAMAD